MFGTNPHSEAIKAVRRAGWENETTEAWLTKARDVSRAPASYESMLAEMPYRHLASVQECVRVYVNAYAACFKHPSNHRPYQFGGCACDRCNSFEAEVPMFDSEQEKDSVSVYYATAGKKAAEHDISIGKPGLSSNVCNNQSYSDAYRSALSAADVVLVEVPMFTEKLSALKAEFARKGSSIGLLAQASSHVFGCEVALSNEKHYSPNSVHIAELEAALKAADELYESIKASLGGKDLEALKKFYGLLVD